MSDYNVRDEIYKLRNENEKIQENWEDEVSDRYQQILNVFNEQLMGLDNQLAEASEELRWLETVYSSLEEGEAKLARRLRR